MGQIIYESASIYVDSATTIRAKIARIEEIQSALLTSALTAATNGHVSEYQLDTGQTKIKANYRNAAEINASYNAFEMIRQTLINRLNGRKIRLVDSKNFRNGYR
jgi:hypothetical protein